MPPALLSLILIPVAAYLVARRFSVANLAAVTGAAVGVVIAPVALEAFVWSMSQEAGSTVQNVGAALMMVHMTPGATLLEESGIAPSPTLAGYGYFAAATINAVVWAVIDALLGHGIDRLRARAGHLAPN